MLEVHLTGSIRDAAGGAASIQLDARTIRELLRKLVEQYPAMQRPMDDGIAVSINGNIYRDNWSQEIPQDAEVYLMPRIQGG